ncbi:hypothetical protein [Rhodoferax sp.]|uniref:hypothetical protein n=1 Tax=Rhodoferax sp. TaxID=50421 RepID=UPI002ACDF0F6|nr:hypothetical protein [Rhodoferax sp.]MDZ7920738.1 hypothetical protein [Rhodoferax sp.]
MKCKRWYCSKTLWFNLILLMLAAAETQLNVLKDVLPGGLYAWLAFILPIGNAALRFVSTTALTVKKQ